MKQINHRFTRPFVVALTLITGFVLVLLIAPLFPRSNDHPVPMVNIEATSIRNALMMYEADFGAFPAGDSRAVFRALRGQNQQHKEYLNTAAQSTSSEEEFLDPWGTPFRIYFSGKEILIRSAGPNKHFDDSGSGDFDDYIR